MAGMTAEQISAAVEISVRSVHRAIDLDGVHPSSPYETPAYRAMMAIPAGFKARTPLPVMPENLYLGSSRVLYGVK